jgi:hypothetical protein
MFWIISIPELSVCPPPWHYMHNEAYTVYFYYFLLLFFLFLPIALMTPYCNSYFIVTEKCICFSASTYLLLLLCNHYKWA